MGSDQHWQRHTLWHLLFWSGFLSQSMPDVVQFMRGKHSNMQGLYHCFLISLYSCISVFCLEFRLGQNLGFSQERVLIQALYSWLLPHFNPEYNRNKIKSHLFKTLLPALFGHHFHIQQVFHFGVPSVTFQNELSWSFHRVVFTMQTPVSVVL